MITLVEFNNVGAITSEVPISVDEMGVEYVIQAGKKGVSFQNHSDVEVWYGNVDVAPKNFIGNKFFKDALLNYKGVRQTFSIFFKTLPGQSAMVGVVTHD